MKKREVQFFLKIMIDYEKTGITEDIVVTGTILNHKIFNVLLSFYTKKNICKKC